MFPKFTSIRPHPVFHRSVLAYLMLTHLRVLWINDF
jgi:hypothetical protein